MEQTEEVRGIDNAQTNLNEDRLLTLYPVNYLPSNAGSVLVGARL
ncbi:MAG: hypothetical protein RL011_1296 [Pseudomonadota bacterium]|jgi:hypothetical protein